MYEVDSACWAVETEKRPSHDDLLNLLWSPDELQLGGNREFAVADEALIERCQLHSQLMTVKGSYAPGRKVLRGCGYQSTNMPRTPRKSH